MGAYDCGIVRVWSIHAYSLSTLRNLLHRHLQSVVQAQQPGTVRNKVFSSINPPLSADFGVGMSLAISPLSFVAQWFAHNCPIRSCMICI
jgi:hypothetical protein